MNSFFRDLAFPCGEHDFDPDKSWSKKRDVNPPQPLAFHDCRSKTWNTSRPVRTAFYAGIMPQELTSRAYKNKIEAMLQAAKNNSPKLTGGSRLRVHVEPENNDCGILNWVETNPCFTRNLINDFTTQNTR